MHHINKQHFKGFKRKRVAEERGFDETAANNVDVKCSNGDILSGNGMFWGYWSEYKYCPAGSAICGIKTRGEC